MISRPKILLALALALTSASCNEDPELVRKNGEQQTEIARLSGELALLQARLNALPGDESDELEKVRTQAEKLQEEQKQLAAEVAELEAEKTRLQEQYQAYQRKYAIR